MRFQDASEEEAAAWLISATDEIDHWQRRFMSGPPTPLEGSAMWGDDAASDPFQLSHAAWLSISHSTDNLHSFRCATVGRENHANIDVTTRPYGAYPNLRATVENAAAAIYMLAPTSRDERLTRRFRIWINDGQQRDKVQRLVRAPATSVADRLTQLRPIAEARNLDIDTIRRYLGFGEVVRGAATATTFDGDNAEAVWRILSGMTHGDTWASLSLLDAEHLSQQLSDRAISLRLTTPMNRLAMWCAAAMAFLRPAFALFDDRCVAEPGP